LQGTTVKEERKLFKTTGENNGYTRGSSLPKNKRSKKNLGIPRRFRGSQSGQFGNGLFGNLQRGGQKFRGGVSRNVRRGGEKSRMDSEEKGKTRLRCHHW